MLLPDELATKHAKGMCSECRGEPYNIKKAVIEAIERCARKAEDNMKRSQETTLLDDYGGGFQTACDMIAKDIRALKGGQ